LIAEHLSRSGGERYILDERVAAPKLRPLRLFRDLLKMESRIYITLGQPLDPFGNGVNAEGESLDPNGHVIDISRYFFRHGAFYLDHHRDREYTTLLGASLLKDLRGTNTIATTHILAHALVEALRVTFPDYSIYRMLGLGRDERWIPLHVVVILVRHFMSQLRPAAADGLLFLEPGLPSKDSLEIVRMADSIFQSYHHPHPTRIDGGAIQARNVSLLYYYGNRLAQAGVLIPYSWNQEEIDTIHTYQRNRFLANGAG